MKHIVLLPVLAASISAFSAENCKPIYEAPATISVSGKSGLSFLSATEMKVNGNALSPKQPAEKLNFVAGSFKFAIVPISSCQDGLEIEFQNIQSNKHLLVPWDREVVVDGKVGSESYVVVTAYRAKR